MINSVFNELRFMKRFLLTFFIVISLLSIQFISAQKNFNAEGIGRSFDIRRIDFTNLSRETLPSQVKTHVFNFDGSDKNSLTSQGVQVYNNSSQDDELETFFVLTHYDFETTLLNKIAQKNGLQNYALAMFSVAYNFSFRELAEPEELIVYSSFYKKLLELKLDFETIDLSEAFIDDVNRLGRDITATGFLYRNGTHFVSKADYGGHFILRNKVHKDYFKYSSLTPDEFAEEIKSNIKSTNSGRNIDYREYPNKVNVGRSDNFTIGGNSNLKDYGKWIETVSDNPELIGVELTRITKLLTKKNFPFVADLENKRKVIDSFIDLAETEAYMYRNQQKQHSFFSRPPIKFRQKVTTIEKIDSGLETESDYTGVLYMGFFGQDEDMLDEQPLFGRNDGDMKSFFTEEVITLNKILEVEVDSIDLKNGYVSVWDDAKKLNRYEGRTSLRVSGSDEAKTKFSEAMNVKVFKNISIQTIDEDRYDVQYTLERVKDFNIFDNSSFARNDVMDSELIAAASNSDIRALQQMFRSGGNKFAKGVIQAAITSPQISIDVLNAIMDEGVKPTTEDLDVAFDPDYFNPHKVLALLERGAKPKNNMIYKAVAYNYPEVVYALLRENAKPINNDLDFAIRRKRYRIVKALMGENIEDYVANEDAVDLAVENEDIEMTKQFIDLGGKAKSSTFAKSATIAQRSKDRAILNLLVPVTEANNETLEAAARINDVNLYKLFIEKDARITDNSSVERAIENKNTEILELALANNAEPTEALEYAIEKDNKEAVVISLENKAQPDKTFDYAVEKKDAELFEEVLNKYEGDPTKALEASVKGDNIKLAETAIEKGNADVSSQLDQVVRDKDMQWVKLLVESGANPDLGIETSISAKKPDISKLLLDKGADANKAIVAAVKEKQPELVRMSLDYNADATLGIKTAVENNDTESALMLLEAGANPSGMLKTATRNMNVKIVEKLIEKGVDPKEAIAIAVNTNSVKLVQMLIDAGADVSSSSFLYTALKNNNPIMSQMLYDNGCDINYKFNSGDTYLHTIADMEGAGDLMSTFIGFGLDVNAKNSLGETPLHLAVQKGEVNFDTVYALLEAGADVHARTKKRKRVFRLAKGTQIKNLLADYGADE